MLSCMFVGSTLLFSSGLVSSSPALAKDDAADPCSDVRLDTGNGSAARLRIYDQANSKTKVDSNLCYAIGVSELTDAWRFSHGDQATNTFTSPEYIAALYASKTKKARQGIVATEGSSHSDWNYTTVEIGDPFYALQDLRSKQSSCSTLGISAATRDIAFKEKIDFLLKFRRKLDDLKLSETEKNRFAKDAYACWMNKLFPGNLASITQDTANAVTTLVDENQFLMKSLDLACTDRVSLAAIPEPKKLNINEFSDYRKGRSEIIQKIYTLLSKKGAQPVGITYCSSVLFNDEECYPHISIIIGKKRVGGQCQFLVRNSYGKKCEMNGYPYVYPCEKARGQVWIPAEKLVENITQLVWLEQ